jgi:hypothetical protein
MLKVIRVLSLAFAVMAGLNFASFVEGDITDEAIKELLESGAGFAFSILDKFAVSSGLLSSDSLRPVPLLSNEDKPNEEAKTRETSGDLDGEA